jgi:hypothetical protein
VMPRAARVCCVVTLAFSLAGCGGPHRTAPVSGRVTLDNKPLPKATVEFVPEAGGGGKEPPPSSVGVTDADGRYTLTLASGGKDRGAVVGKHRVLISLGPEAAANDARPTFHKQLPEKYNRKSTLTCEVPAGGREDANFDLRSR